MIGLLFRYRKYKKHIGTLLSLLDETVQADNRQPYIGKITSMIWVMIHCASGAPCKLCKGTKS